MIDYKWARENFNLHKAREEAAKIPSKVNPTGAYYKYLLKAIENKYQVKL